MQYIMTDWLGRPIGYPEKSYVPLVEMGRRLNETHDLVIWEIDDKYTRRVIGIVGPKRDKIRVFRI